MVAIDEKYIPRKADNSGPQNPTLAWQGKQGYQFEQALGAAGLQYVRQRWYDPSTRQFISPDPLGFPMQQCRGVLNRDRSPAAM